MSTTSAHRIATHPTGGASSRPRYPRVPDDIEASDARAILVTALAAIEPHRLPLVTSLAPEGIVILDLLTQLLPHPRVLTLDTGHLPSDTLRLIGEVERRFGVQIEVIHPEADDVNDMVSERGADLYYRSLEDRLRCCDVRKVIPLRSALADADGWITGLRRGQSPTRATTPKIGLDLANGLIWKVAPLADWSSEQVWEHIRSNDLPYNALHDEGYSSIGCAPCTRPVTPGEDERAGRWWWESDADPRECGLHIPPQAASA